MDEVKEHDRKYLNNFFRQWENGLQWQIKLVKKAIQFQLGDLDDNSKFEIDFGDYDFKTEIPCLESSFQRSVI